MSNYESQNINKKDVKNFQSLRRIEARTFSQFKKQEVSDGNSSGSSISDHVEETIKQLHTEQEPPIEKTDAQIDLQNVQEPSQIDEQLTKLARQHTIPLPEISSHSNSKSAVNQQTPSPKDGNIYKEPCANKVVNRQVTETEV